jgi:transposase
LFTLVDLEARVRRDHPLRAIRRFADAALEALSPEFSALYSARMGRPSIAPEMLLRAMLLQAFYSIRSERQLMERLEFDLLFRWPPRGGAIPQGASAHAFSRVHTGSRSGLGPLGCTRERRPRAGRRPPR